MSSGDGPGKVPGWWLQHPAITDEANETVQNLGTYLPCGTDVEPTSGRATAACVHAHTRYCGAALAGREDRRDSLSRSQCRQHRTAFPTIDATRCWRTQISASSVLAAPLAAGNLQGTTAARRLVNSVPAVLSGYCKNTPTL